MMIRVFHKLTLVAFSLALLCGRANADWTTGRGNLQRTGNLDGQRGPAKPNIAWAYKAAEHFVAPPVPDVGALYIAGLGAFSTPTFHAFTVDPDAADRTLWAKAAPYLKLPTVSSPAVSDGLVVFGDGMHQTDGATLYCIRAENGRPVWQYPVPGHLVHMEGAPTIDKDRVFIGGGDAGVICVELKKVTLDGQEQDLAAVQKLIDARWAVLMAQYAEAKKKDPDFAIPPSEDALPKPAPKLVWQQGQGTLHVDAAVAVIGERVLVASAFIDAEKVGKRVLVCLNAADGKVMWETPLEFNPWAGATVSGNTVLVGCSSIRFDRKLIDGAKGEVVAINLENGQIKWRKPVPAGVLSTIAVSEGLAVATATDGIVRAWSVADGAEKWATKATDPFFAGPAIAGGSVYVADLKGVVQSINLTDGAAQWSFNATADPAVQSPGMFFGSPVVHGGDLFLATCNIEGENTDLPSVVICLSDKSAAGVGNEAGAIVIDKESRSITINAKIAQRKLPYLKEVYPLEVVATFASPRGQKAHETVVTFDAKPSAIHSALEELGLKPGTPAKGEGAAATGPEVRVYLELPGIGEKVRRIPIEPTMIDNRTGKQMPPLKWYFTGSAMRQPNPDKPAKVYGADLSGTLMTIYPVSDETVFQSDLTMKDESMLKLDTNRNILPPEGTSVKLRIEAK
jgi:outer membrane protein assembly factor BamB